MMRSFSTKLPHIDFFLLSAHFLVMGMVHALYYVFTQFLSVLLQQGNEM